MAHSPGDESPAREAGQPLYADPAGVTGTASESGELIEVQHDEVAEVQLEPKDEDPFGGPDRLVLVTAVWCGVDRPVRDICAQAKLPEGATHLVVDADRDPQLADRFSVQTLPTVLWIRDGKDVARLTGSFGRSDMDRFVQEAGKQTTA